MNMIWLWGNWLLLTCWCAFASTRQHLTGTRKKIVEFLFDTLSRVSVHNRNCVTSAELLLLGDWRCSRQAVDRRCSAFRIIFVASSNSKSQARLSCHSLCTTHTMWHNMYETTTSDICIKFSNFLLRYAQNIYRYECGDIEKSIGKIRWRTPFAPKQNTSTYTRKPYSAREWREAIVTQIACLVGIVRNTHT